MVIHTDRSISALPTRKNIPVSQAEHRKPTYKKTNFNIKEG
jgi:hypothetical protein